MLTALDLAGMAMVVAAPSLLVTVLRSKPAPPRALALCAFALYLAVLVGLAFGGIPLEGDHPGRVGGLGPVNLRPFWFVDNLIRDPSWRVVLQSLGNLLLLTPLGFLLPMLWERFERVGAVAVAAFLASLTIELGQLVISTLLSPDYRLFEVDDLMLNTVGAALGWVGWRATGSAMTARRRSTRPEV